MAGRYEDEDEFDREDGLEDEDEYQADDEDEDSSYDLDDDEEDSSYDLDDEDDGDIIDFGTVDRQAAEAKAKRVLLLINDDVYRFLPSDQWPYSAIKAISPGKDIAPDFELWAEKVLPARQAQRLIRLDMTAEQYMRLVNKLQVAERRAKRRLGRSGDPRKRAQGKSRRSRP